MTSEALPAALCPSSLSPYTAARLGTSPSAALRSRQGKKKKKKKAHVVIAQAQARARAGPAREEAGSERGSDSPPAPGPLGTVVLVKEARVLFWVSWLGRSAKTGKRHYTMSIYASCRHQKEVPCYAKSLTKNSVAKPKSHNKKQTSHLHTVFYSFPKIGS